LASRRLLLDTHVWLWWKADDRRLGKHARHAIVTAAEVRFSAASAWEIAIKTAAGKLTTPAASNLVEEIERDGFQPLPVTLAHAEELRSLPTLHRDPFDRMLVAQARVEGLTLVTSDERLAGYDVTVLRATE
jgi:PIN domain nuclease of toxin-antitoxin system